MLYIKYNNGISRTTYVQYLSNGFAVADDIKYVIADGDEAEYIKQRFGTFTTVGSVWNMSIPWNFKSHAQSQTWFGDIARAILANL